MVGILWSRHCEIFARSMISQTPEIPHDNEKLTLKCRKRKSTRSARVWLQLCLMDDEDMETWAGSQATTSANARSNVDI
jgi:hypothetical protein